REGFGTRNARPGVHSCCQKPPPVIRPGGPSTARTGRRKWSSPPPGRRPARYPSPMSDEAAMELALEEAEAAVAHGDVPIGAAARAGACGSLYNLCADPRLNHELPVTGGLLAERASGLLQTFFAQKRGR